MSANWYVLRNGGDTVGPMTSDQVRSALARGEITPDTRANLAGSDEWRAVSAIPEFGGGVFARSPGPAPQKIGFSPGRGLFFGFAGLTFLVGALVGAVTHKLLAGSSDSGVTEPVEPSANVVVDAAPPAPSPAPKNPMTELLATKDLTAALEITKPLMSDSTNNLDAGTSALALWAVNHMKWTDVYVQTDEVSIAAVKKDSDGARGKRMCVGGSLIEIQVFKTEQGKGFEGLLMTNAVNLIKFVAAGSTGELVQRSNARFCGVVTGQHHYSNSAGGVGHAVAMVGMFDLPENK